MKALELDSKVWLEERSATVVYKPKSSKSHSFRPFSTDSCWSGYAPSNTKVGDVICHFNRSELAVVVREYEAPASGIYSIIGSAVASKTINASPPSNTNADDSIWLHLDMVTLQQLTTAANPELTTLLSTNFY